MTEKAYLVPGMSCEHCRASVSRELLRVAGVSAVDVDLETKLVRVHGTRLEDAALVEAIDDAGYDAEPLTA